MVRSFIVLLLLAVFFLTGMLLGIDRGQNAEGDSNGKVEEIVVNQSKKGDTIQNKEPISENISEPVMNVDSSPHFTQKMASVLESGIKWFYDMVVLIVYQIAELFF